MSDGDFWMTVKERDGAGQRKRIGAVRVALLFGTAAIAVATILTPILADRSTSARVAWKPDQYDNLTTGSIPQRAATTVYTVRKSILQERPGSLCIIQNDGSKSGDC
ncbi:MAG: membrane protein [Hoeflea sp. BRH_c9]|nr:MAG: membrane protein [Hoeflea sp. BRH_c9]